MKAHPIPDAAFDLHSAFLGMTGSGKTSTAKLAVERLVARGARVCVLDPIKSDWWGITSSADGKAPGLPFFTLGGSHGDLPLDPGSGERVAELVASGALPLSIIDMARGFGPGDHARFFVDFARTLFARMQEGTRGVLYLVMEEAHLFAPKERVGGGAENYALYWSKMLATGGRSIGLRLIVSSQRTQSLHNALLSSCETMVAHRVGIPDDQKPVVNWFKGHAPARAKEIAGTLATLPTGTGWLCSRHVDTVDRIAFPRISTFDNTATPDLDTVSGGPVVRAKVDVAAIRKALAADDDTKSDAAPKPSSKAPRAKDITADLEAAERRGYERGLSEGLHRGGDFAADGATEIASALEAVIGMVGAHGKLAKSGRWALPGQTATASSGKPDDAERAARAAALADAQRREHQEKRARPVKRAVDSAPKSEASDRIPLAHQRILDAIAWFESIGITDVEREIAAFIAGASSRSSSFANNISALRTRGLIDYPAGGAVALTAAGRDRAVRPARALTHEVITEAVREKLAPVQWRLLSVAIRWHPKEISRESLADTAEVSPASSSFANNVSRLRTLGLITYPAGGFVRAADLLFPERSR